MLGQQAYIKQIIKSFDLENSYTAVMPIEPRADFTHDSPSISPIVLLSTEKTHYYEMIDSLMYAAIMACPDIAYAISVLSQYLEAP